MQCSVAWDLPLSHLESSPQGSAWWRVVWARSAPSPCHSDTDCCSPLHIQIVYQWLTHQWSPKNWSVQDRHIFDEIVLMWLDAQLLCNRLTCCLLLCRPVDPPAPASPGVAAWGWSGSSFGLSVPIWLCQSAHQNLPGSDPAPRPQGWFETLGGSCWPWQGQERISIGTHKW